MHQGLERSIRVRPGHRQPPLPVEEAWALVGLSGPCAPGEAIGIANGVADASAFCDVQAGRRRVSAPGGASGRVRG